MKKIKGFTLIELMIVVAIIGILAAIAIPKFADLINKANEGATKGSMSALRSAMSIYYSENEGEYPRNTGAATNDALGQLSADRKYLDDIPFFNSGVNEPAHGRTNAQSNISGGAGEYVCVGNGPAWVYLFETDTGDRGTRGKIYVGCTHPDTRGTTWTRY